MCYPHIYASLQNSRATAQKVTSIVVRVETNQITVQNTKKNLISDRKNAVDLAAWEWGVEEEGDLDVLLAVTNLLTKHGRQEHQVVVVDPDEVTVLDILGNSFSKEAVGFLVGVPSRLVEGDFARVVVE